MSNPFPAHFDSHCTSCGENIYESDDTFAIDREFVCENCAESNGNICPKCGSFKKEEYDTCFDCKDLEK